MESGRIKKGKSKTLDSFFKPKEATSSSSKQPPPSSSDQNISKRQRVEGNVNSLERDPGLRIPICEYPVNERDEIRRAYIDLKPYQPAMSNYPRTQFGDQYRRFQLSWFDKFSWLEYFITKDAAYCFPCFLFENKNPRYPAFTTEGFRSWKRVNCKTKCPFLVHVGGSNSPHNNNVKAVEDLENVTRHIDKVMSTHTLDDVQKNRLRITTSIEVSRWLGMQGCTQTFDIFNVVIDFQVEEINNRFNDESVELLKLSASLEPRDDFKSFDIDSVCTLTEEFYPNDFCEQEIHHLRSQLNYYRRDVLPDERFQKISTIAELCQTLFKTNKSSIFHLIDMLLRLVLTLPVTTATTEQAFSAMKIVKLVLRNKMEEEFLADNMVLYIERELSASLDVDSVIDEFYSLKDRKAKLR